MPSLKLLLPGVLLLLALPPAVQAQEDCDGGCQPDACVSSGCQRLTWKQRWDAYWEEFEMHRARANLWPEPFVQPDRELVREPFRQMAENGWKEQNTFGEALFEDRTELNEAGRHKLRLTLTEFPPHRRVIFVLAGETPEVTGARVASVYRQMAEICQGSQSYPVYVTAIPPRDRAGLIGGVAGRSLLAPIASQQGAPQPSSPTTAAAANGYATGGAAAR